MKSTAFRGATVYAGIPLLAAGTFLGVTIAGDYGWVDRLGGAAWVFGLSMIVLIPVVPGLLKGRARGQQGGHHD